jgi:HEPN domain-containing protein
MDEATSALTAEWLAKASEDFHAAKLLIAGGLVMPALFHCQQAAEKGIKAYLCFYRQPLERTHDIARLVELAIMIEPDWQDTLGCGAILSPLAVDYRYPGDSEAPDSRQALAACSQILDAVRMKLPETLFPSTWPKN